MSVKSSVVHTCLGPGEVEGIAMRYADQGFIVAVLGYVEGQGYYLAMNREEN